MSEYGRLWEQIAEVRRDLAMLMGAEPGELNRLSEAIELCAARGRRIASLLSRWAAIEEQMAKLHRESGESYDDGLTDG
jgi:hypothetical protein